MRRSIMVAGMSVTVVAALAHMAHATVPSVVVHHGRLVFEGTPVDDTVTLGLSFFEAQSGGTALWSQTGSVPVVQGYYSVAMDLASGGPGVDALLDQDELWLGISVNGAAELVPRLRLMSVPYALWAARAEVAEDIDCLGCVSAAAVAFNYAIGDSQGAATGLACADQCVQTAEIANNAIITQKIYDLNVTTEKLAEASVTVEKLANLAVTTGKLADGAVTTEKLASNSVTADKIPFVNQDLRTTASPSFNRVIVGGISLQPFVFSYPGGDGCQIGPYNSCFHVCRCYLGYGICLAAFETCTTDQNCNGTQAAYRNLDCSEVFSAGGRTQKCLCAWP